VSELDPERRRHLLERVTAWLEDLAQAELPPPGLAPEIETSSEAAPDLYSFLSQLAALTREVQLHGRATNRLHTELGTALENLAANTSSPEAMAGKLSEARREARLELVAELLEVRDCFLRGLEEAQRRLTARRGVRAWLGQRPVLEAMVEGNRLARERLDDLLRRLDIHEIPCLGEPFDPTRMRAIEVVRTPSAPPGTVIEVFRPGYTGNGRVLRYAEVRVVAGAPPGTGDGANG
jgi:molecular chaperone GrpE (heat shock protein)